MVHVEIALSVRPISWTTAKFMTAAELAQNDTDKKYYESNRPHSPPLEHLEGVHPCSSATRKRPRKQSTKSSLPIKSARNPPPPYPLPTSIEEVPTIGQTRPPTPAPYGHGNCTGTRYPFLRGCQKGQKGCSVGNLCPERLPDVFRAENGCMSGPGGDDGAALGEDASVASERKMSKAAKLWEEDRKKIASIRSFLLNFLEERDCSIKKRLVGKGHQGDGETMELAEGMEQIPRVLRCFHTRTLVGRKTLMTLPCHVKRFCEHNHQEGREHVCHLLHLVLRGPESPTTLKFSTI